MEDSQEYQVKKALSMVHSLRILQSYLTWHEDKEEKRRMSGFFYKEIE